VKDKVAFHKQRKTKQTSKTEKSGGEKEKYPDASFE